MCHDRLLGSQCMQRVHRVHRIEVFFAVLDSFEVGKCNLGALEICWWFKSVTLSGSQGGAGE